MSKHHARSAAAVHGVSVKTALGADTFQVTGGTDTITDLGNGTDVLVVSIDAIANATVTAAWTSTAGTENKGTANIVTKGYNVNLATTSGSGTTGFKVTNVGLAATLTDSSKADTLIGGIGNDSILATTGGDDILMGGAGDDTINGATVTDTVDGGSGNDTLIIASGASYTGAVNSALTGIERIAADAAGGYTIDISLQSESITLVGGAGVDTLTGGLNSDSLDGGGSADVLDGGANNDVLTGGAAADTFNVTAGTDAITDLSVGGTADLLVVSSGAVANAKVAGAFTATSGTVNNGTANLTTETFLVSMAAATGSNGFTLIQAAKVLSSKVLVTNTALATITGSAAADTIYGAGAADSLVGGAGNDAIFGNEGADTITGGTGQDTITGGAGADTFIFAAGDSSVTAPDVIVGYTVLVDKLDLANTATVAANVTVGTASIVSGLVKDTATGVNGVFTSVAAGVTAAQATVTVADAAAFFKVASDYYVFQEEGASDILVKLTGITSATTIGTSAADILIA